MYTSRTGTRLTGAGYKSSASNAADTFMNDKLEARTGRATGIGADMRHLEARPRDLSAAGASGPGPTSPAALRSSCYLDRLNEQQHMSAVRRSADSAALHSVKRATSREASSSGATRDIGSPYLTNSARPRTSELTGRPTSKPQSGGGARSPYLQNSTRASQQRSSSSSSSNRQLEQDSRPSTMSSTSGRSSSVGGAGRRPTTSSSSGPTVVSPSQQGKRLMQTYGIVPPDVSRSQVVGLSGVVKGAASDSSPPAVVGVSGAAQHSGDSSVQVQRQVPGDSSGLVVGRPRSARPGSARGAAGVHVMQGRESEHGAHGRDMLINSYDDIPVISEEERVLEGEERLAAEQQPPGQAGPYVGLTLDQYMSRMVTTPASAAATSGLGQGEWAAGHRPASARGRRFDPEDSPSDVPSPIIAGVGVDHHSSGAELPTEELSDLDSVPSPGVPSPPAQLGGASRQLAGTIGSRSQTQYSTRAQPSAWRAAGSWGMEEVEEEAELQSSREDLLSDRRQMSGRASALAMSNSLDLRPATAATPDMLAGGAGGGQLGYRGDQRMMRLDDHHNLIKETDLGDLSAALFTPNANQLMASGTAAGAAAGPGNHAGSTSMDTGSLRLGNLMAAAAAAAAAGDSFDAPGAKPAALSPAGAARRGAPAAMSSPRAGNARNMAAAAVGQGAPAHTARGTHGAHHDPSIPTVKLQDSSQAAKGGGRMVQSARPVTRGAEELDPSVWENCIAVQLERPPSRQKPPPEALHLWAPGDNKFGMPQDPQRLGHNRGARPQSAVTTNYRSRPMSGPVMGKKAGLPADVQNTSVARPPTRQKPPPMSLLLEHDSEFAYHGSPTARDAFAHHGELSDDSETDF